MVQIALHIQANQRRFKWLVAFIGVLSCCTGCGNLAVSGNSSPAISSSTISVRALSVQVIDTNGKVPSYNLDVSCQTNTTATITESLSAVFLPLNTGCTVSLKSFTLTGVAGTFTPQQASSVASVGDAGSVLISYANPTGTVVYASGALTSGSLNTQCSNPTYADANRCSVATVSFSIATQISSTISSGNLVYNPSLGSFSQAAVPIVQGSASQILVTSLLESTFSCTYQSIGLSASDPNYAASGSACSNLSGLSLTSTSAYATQLSWTPTTSQFGSFLFNVASNNKQGTQTTSFYATVREAYATANILSSFNALTAAGYTNDSTMTSTPLMPIATNTRGNWLNEVTSSYIGALSATGTAAPWTGVGTIANPYSLSFTTASSDSVSLGSVLNTMTKFLVSVWAKPSSVSTASKVIASNNSGSTGFTLAQSQQTTGRIQTSTTGHSYQAEVLADKPMAYLSFQDTSYTDLSGLGHNGGSAWSMSTVDSTTQPLAGIASTSSNQSTGGRRFVTWMNWLNPFPAWVGFDYAGTTPLTARHSFALEIWGKWSSTSHGLFISTDGCCVGGGTSTGFYFYTQNGYIYSTIDSTSGVGNTLYIQTTATFNDNNWHHVVNVYDNPTEKFIIYVDGVAQPITKVQGCGTVVGTYLNTTGCNNFSSLIIDPSAYYLTIGGWVDGWADAFGGFIGNLAQPAVYLDRSLSAARVWAHYSVGKVNGCLSQTQPANGTWYNLASLFDGTYLSLFVNGTLECQIMGSLTNSAQNLTLGATLGGNYWSGNIGDVKVYGTKDGSAVGTASTVNTNFQAQRTRFGQ